MINQLKIGIDGKFKEINLQMKDIKESFASTVNDIVVESILKVKNSIIKTLKEENIKLKILEARLFDSEKASNK